MSLMAIAALMALALAVTVALALRECTRVQKMRWRRCRANGSVPLAPRARRGTMRAPH